MTNRTYLRSIVLALAVLSSQIAFSKGTFVAQKTATKYGASETVGRFLYTGNVPRILNPSDLEMYVSKTMLTVRAKAWISNEQALKYPAELILYWNAIREAFQSDSLTFVPLVNMEKLAAQQKEISLKARLGLIAKLYSQDQLDQQGLDIYHAQDPKSYKSTLLLALLRAYTLNPAATLQDGLNLVVLAKSNQHAQLNAALPSLLQRQLSENFTAATERADHIGYLTFVYAIAATTAGPFSIDFPGVYHLGQFEGDDARWHSFKWNDEFGGFPFLQYTDYGVAFHGPITQTSLGSVPEGTGDYNLWYLRRGYVSHGCHRMDPNDLMELRQMLPAKVNHPKSDYSKLAVQVVTRVYPDNDIQDGLRVVFNVDYYTPMVQISKGQTADQTIAHNTIANFRTSFLKNNIVNLANDPQTGKNQVAIPDLKAGALTINGITPFLVENGRVTEQAAVDGVLIKNYPFRGIRIIQYREASVHYTDGSTNDDGGKYPPSYFSNERYLKE